MHCAVEPSHCFKLRKIKVCHVSVQSFAISKVEDHLSFKKQYNNE